MIERPAFTPFRSNLVTGRSVLMGNSTVRLSYCAATTDSGLYRDADGDQCVYVESGEGTDVHGDHPGQGRARVLPFRRLERGHTI